ncbi:MAG TPA: guanylate kinase [Chloroflexota bacterium]|nr:guanylate kinase [Chloroflexota bacterium]
MTNPATPARPSVLDTCSTSMPDVWPYNQELAPREGLVVVLSGPSGVGKDTVIEAIERSGFPIEKIVTATTRAIRNTEVDGRDYHFLTPEEFQRWRDEGRFLESAEIYGRFYGTPKAEVQQALARGRVVLLKIDVQGAAQIRQSIPNAVYIFLGPESADELIHRLERRGTESEAQFQRRIQHARWELEQAKYYEFLVINRHDQVACAAEQIKAIVVSERLRVEPRHIEIK